MDRAQSLLLQRDRSFLVLIDVQERLLPSIHGGEQVLKNAAILLKTARELGVPLVVSEQYVKGLGPTVAGLAALLGNAPKFEKMHFSCMADEYLAGQFASLKAEGRDQAVLIGTEAHVCVLQTALGLCAEGYEVFVVADAVSSRTADNRDLALARCREAGVNVVSTEMVAFEWLNVSGTPEFKSVAKLIK